MVAPIYGGFMTVLRYAKKAQLNQLLTMISMEQLINFCQDWKIDELALFGSILRDDFQVTSDIDILVTFGNEATWGLFDHVKMQQELRNMLGRDVDLISKRAVLQSQNWLRREEILNSARVVFSAQEMAHAA